MMITYNDLIATIWVSPRSSCEHAGSPSGSQRIIRYHLRVPWMNMKWFLGSSWLPLWCRWALWRSIR